MSRAERTLLPQLRERIGRIERLAATVHGILPFGSAEIDQALPGGGLARGALHEILGVGGDEKDGVRGIAGARRCWLRLFLEVTRTFTTSFRKPDSRGLDPTIHRPKLPR